MEDQRICMESCGCRKSQAGSTNTNFLSSFVLIVIVGVVSLPSGSCAPHISSVLEHGDAVPGIPVRYIPRGPTVAPVPSPETLDQLELANDEDKYFDPAETIRNLLNLSPSVQRVHGLKRVSQFHGNGEPGILGAPGYRSAPNNLEYDGDDVVVDEKGQPTFVPFIGARALTNIPEFFTHLRENIEALKLSHPDEADDSSEAGDNSNDENDLYTDLEERPPKKDSQRPAARRMRTEFHVDENSIKPADWSSKQNWRPHAAGAIHYYAPSQQHILRRANNYNPSWLYTNLGLGKRRR